MLRVVWGWRGVALAVVLLDDSIGCLWSGCLDLWFRLVGYLVVVSGLVVGTGCAWGLFILVVEVLFRGFGGCFLIGCL